jgi:hypothetical protein
MNHDAMANGLANPNAIIAAVNAMYAAMEPLVRPLDERKKRIGMAVAIKKRTTHQNILSNTSMTVSTSMRASFCVNSGFGK